MSPESTSEAPLSEFARVTGVFFDPKKAFADIAARPRWWVPLVLLIAMTTAFMTTFSQRVGWDTYMRQVFEKSSRTQNLPAEQKERAMEQAARIAVITGTAGAIVGVPIAYLATAGILLLVFKMMGQQFGFKQMFAVTCYSFLTGVVSAALGIVVMFLKNPEDFNLQNPLMFNLGAFLDPETSAKWLVSLGTSIDLFSFWTIALLATGIAAIGHKLPWSKALTGVAIPWAILVVCKTGWAAMFK